MKRLIVAQFAHTHPCRSILSFQQSVRVFCLLSFPLFSSSLPSLKKLNDWWNSVAAEDEAEYKI
jgi:hypothetical protein